MAIHRPTFQRPSPDRSRGNAPRVGITLGDPNGIGPEVILKCLHEPELPPMLPLVIGSPHVLRVHADTLGYSDLTIHVVDEVPETVPSDGITVLRVGEETPTVSFGAVTAAGGALAMEAVARAVDACTSGALDAMVTAPISKDAIAQAGHTAPGHTEFIAERTGTAQPTMMMVAGGLRVGLVTGHIPVSQIAAGITQEAILQKLRVLERSLTVDFGIEAPRIAVLGLNPHAGDGGVLGREEEQIIGPALARARGEGFDVEGPLPADGYFATQLDEGYDAVLAMYHDQGLVPFKALAFDRGVNYTAGLPIVRTSPDHGTAYGIAGKGMALPGSMRSALELAVVVAQNRARYEDAAQRVLP
ncbi:4-hydroxythreonine-4-phosphate dehydrogenase PdxA [Salisaeta longa]|uniref:4-hydroxythreonine-4-phosphate dehydrogenase PdxA n=1 Tax=Salisaeta longa TaxID=503170 RepID=UPI0003B669FD|nr:4-hydroxythreonine-4-phosphate dehydrogenase PdxA [Salisaeta longa]